MRVAASRAPSPRHSSSERAASISRFEAPRPDALLLVLALKDLTQERLGRASSQRLSAHSLLNADPGDVTLEDIL